MDKPKLIAFDLDYTLWPFWVDTHVSPPFRKESNGNVYDSSGRLVGCYPDVPEMLASLQAQGIQLAAASRTSCTNDANALCRLFDWDRFFSYKQIYPGSKITHFQKFHQESGIAYRDMLFFDDEYRNIKDVSTLGVTCIFARNGMSTDKLQEGLQEFAANAKQRSTK